MTPSMKAGTSTTTTMTTIYTHGNDNTFDAAQPGPQTRVPASRTTRVQNSGRIEPDEFAVRSGRDRRKRRNGDARAERDGRIGEDGCNRDGQLASVYGGYAEAWPGSHSGVGGIHSAMRKSSRCGGAWHARGDHQGNGAREHRCIIPVPVCSVRISSVRERISRDAVPRQTL